jgi:hypothetical protein
MDKALFPKKEEKIYRSFLISFCLVIALSISGIYLGLNIETRKLIYASLGQRESGL